MGAFGSPAVLHPDKIDAAEQYLAAVLDPPPKAAGPLACETCGSVPPDPHAEGCTETPF